ncbi:D-glycerate dehydrogenase [Clostridiaceae bacterium HSG29]|nr:D-glycerate dehydrogenase [Clostridiaceae bacterium HSG29]
MKKVYITMNIPEIAEKLLKEEFEVVVNTDNKFLSKEALIQLGCEYDAILSALTNIFDEDILSKCTKTKIFANYAVGFNNFDIDYIKENSIIVTNTPGVLSDTTAETAISLLFAVSRRVVEADRFVREGKWEGFSPKLLLGKDIYNKTLGIIGAGRIGHRFAEKLRGFHMKILYHNRERDLCFEKSFNAEYCELDDLLKRSDIVTIHVPLTEKTRYMITKKEIDLMKDDAILINTSRGSVIKEEDLIEALENKKIYGAGLDVFEDEPNINSRFFELNNTVLLPHIGSASKETREMMATIAAKNIIRVLKGGEPINLVY